MVDFDKLKEEQLRLSKKVILKNDCEKIELVAGVDQAFEKENIISAIVVCDYNTMEVKEKVHSVVKEKLPYVPGFLSYREGPAISEAYARLENKPDIMLVDGNGILHPRKFGLASHMGVLLDQTTIGIAKQLMLGEIKKEKVYVDDEPRAVALVTRKHAKPIYISPGHNINLKTSIEVVKNCIKFPHKLPEPLHLAHRYSKELVKELVK